MKERNITVGRFNLEYCGFVEQGRWYAHAGEKNTQELIYNALGVGGEAGEHVDAIKKIIRLYGVEHAWEQCSDEHRMKITQEAGDVLWYIQNFCIFLGIDLEELMLLNIVKLYQRMLGTDKEIPWPLTNIPYEGALSLTQHTEYQITARSASRSTDTATS